MKGPDTYHTGKMTPIFRSKKVLGGGRGLRKRPHGVPDFRKRTNLTFLLLCVVVSGGYMPRFSAANTWLTRGFRPFNSQLRDRLTEGSMDQHP